MKATPGPIFCPRETHKANRLSKLKNTHSRRFRKSANRRSTKSNNLQSKVSKRSSPNPTLHEQHSLELVWPQKWFSPPIANMLSHFHEVETCLFPYCWWWQYSTFWANPSPNTTPYPPSRRWVIPTECRSQNPLWTEWYPDSLVLETARRPIWRGLCTLFRRYSPLRCLPSADTLQSSNDFQSPIRGRERFQSNTDSGSFRCTLPTPPRCHSATLISPHWPPRTRSLARSLYLHQSPLSLFIQQRAP